jgi:hypothetical protein
MARPTRTVMPTWLSWLGLLVLIGMLGRLIYDDQQRLRLRAFSETMVATPDQLAMVLEGGIATDAPLQWRRENRIRVDDAGLRAGTRGILATGATYATAPHDGVTISFVVLDYGRATEATFHFWRLAPAALATDRPWQWVDVPYRSPYAHQQKAACLTVTAHGCQHWSLWSRYGRYILRMDIALPAPQVLDAAALNLLVATSERVFWQNMR